MINSGLKPICLPDKSTKKNAWYPDGEKQLPVNFHLLSNFN